jgi:uncharacterized protein with HEPN domain
LLDILAAIAAIERYLDRDRAAFENDELLQNWFLRHLQIIGEAARTLPEEVRALAPEIPWSNIIGMRNILVHGYFEIDTEIVWNAATRDVPAIKPAMERLLKTLEEQGRCPYLVTSSGEDQDWRRDRLSALC